ncbi:MAG: hypothetical protein JO091_11925 [Acidobacteriaceae bacterium]|nr:hypothetical protein [Acidobacteriaceae bacterium]
MLWRSILLAIVAAYRLGAAPVTYTFSDSYSYSDPTSRLASSAYLSLVAPDFLNGLNTFTKNQTQACSGGGLADGSVYSYNCQQITLDISGTFASVEMFGCLTTLPSLCNLFVDESFVVVPNESGTWYGFHPLGFPPGTNGGSSFAVNFEPEPSTFVLMAPALLLPLLLRARANRHQHR